MKIEYNVNIIDINDEEVYFGVEAEAIGSVCELVYHYLPNDVKFEFRKERLNPEYPESIPNYVIYAYNENIYVAIFSSIRATVAATARQLFEQIIEKRIKNENLQANQIPYD